MDHKQIDLRYDKIMKEKYHNILDQIGGTPLVPLRRLNPHKGVEILAKLEYFNPGGSIKDRAALSMIEAAEKSGELTKDKIILEATSGNTGIGLAMVASVKGYRILLTMSEAVSEERVKILKALGAKIRFTPARLGTDGAIEQSYKMLREDPQTYWLADQFNNEANWLAHYHGTAMEIWEQAHGDLDAVVVTMGTTGTLMGLARRFRELDPRIRVIGVEPFLGHKIQGLKNMKESYRPEIFQKDMPHRIIKVDDEEAYEMARQLAKMEGMFVGMSSGAAMAIALKVAGEMENGTIVVIFPDGGERYLSTPLFVAKKRTGLKIYNTLTRRKEEFIPIRENEVTLYSCGPTLCQFIDLGQCRRILFSDLVRRYMEFKGYAVTQIMNLTDLDDRTIEGARAAGISLKAFTDQFHEALMSDLDQLNIKRATAYPRPSEHIDDMIRLVEKLIAKGYAYEKLRSIYFDISRFPEYGRLSRIDLDKIQVGKTVDLDQYEKENPRDFTLLKRSTLNELKSGIFFETQWGHVRPGWHLECAAMAMKYLSPPYDIHTSGVELIFPHHENAIAISKAAIDSPLAHYWLHNEPVTAVDEADPSEAENGRLTLTELLEQGVTGREVRYWILSRHYRKRIFFSKAKFASAKNTLRHLDKFVQKLHFSSLAPTDPEMDQAVYALRHQFMEAMDDDFNVSQALAALFGFTRKMNKKMDGAGLSEDDRQKTLEALEGINSVLGIMELTLPEGDREVEERIAEREQARRERDWERADRIRDQLAEKGIEITDTPRGPLWKRT
ncbi:MAG: cysteine--tRNA ligase [Thermodesulfobacteriota bacterium]